MRRILTSVEQVFLEQVFTSLRKVVCVYIYREYNVVTAISRQNTPSVIVITYQLVYEILYKMRTTHSRFLRGEEATSPHIRTGINVV